MFNLCDNSTHSSLESPEKAILTYAPAGKAAVMKGAGRTGTRLTWKGEIKKLTAITGREGGRGKVGGRICAVIEVGRKKWRE